MPEVDTQLDEQQQQVEQDQTTDVQSTTDDSTDNQYFLEVDERTKYKTAEDAQKAYKEAGERIAQLSSWEKEIGKAYNADPQQVAAALDEYLQMKEAQAQADATKA